MSGEPRKAIASEEFEQILEIACRATGMSRAEMLRATGLEWRDLHRKEEPKPITLADIRERMTRARVPELFIRSVGVRAPVDCFALREVRSFLEARNRRVLVLSGGRGTRKTGSAAWALGQLMGGRFLASSRILATVIDDRDYWSECLRAPLLVLDDLGVEVRDSRGTFLTHFHALIENAYSACRRLIVTTNLSFSQFRAEPDQGGYGVRVYDRIVECGTWSTVAGESVRASLREPGEDDE